MMHQKKQIKLSDIVIPKYLKIFNDKRHKHIILTSGRAGTKSSFIAIRGDYQITSDPGGSVVVLRKHHNKLRKTVYKEMMRAINRLQIPKNRFQIGKSPMEITYQKYGTTIYFSGSDGIDDTKGIIDEDKPIKLVILEELTEFFEDGEGEDELANIEATFVRGNKGGFQMIYLYNPPKNPNAPINQWCKKMEKRSDCLHIHTDYRDVPVEWLGQDLINSAEEMHQADEKMYRWIWLGESVGVDETIYYMFSDRHRVRPEEGRQYQIIYIGGDYGQQNATTFQAFGLDDYRKKLTGLAEFYHSGRTTGRQKTPSEYAVELMGMAEALHQEYGTLQFNVFLDPSAQGLQEEIKRMARNCTGFSLRVKNAENDVALGISRVQKAFTFQVLTIAPTQENLIRELEMYEYDKQSLEKGKEVPVKLEDHACDALRYLVMGAWKYLKRWLPENEKEEESIETEEEKDEYL